MIVRLLAPFQRFARMSSAGGIVLLATTALALGWANSPWAHSYHALWTTSRSIAIGSWTTDVALHHVINDGLMSVFFFLVGLEIKREIVAGELASVRSAALPMFAALGGMAAPAIIYFLISGSGPGAAGWGVPMATDIAFALGVLALLGDRVPTGLKVFLAALAIVDDIGAILVIAIFYSRGVAWGALGAAVMLLLLAAGANRAGVRNPWAYAAIGLGLWVAVLASGVHATVAGVLMAMTIPMSTLLRLEHVLLRPVAFGILPLFALSNAGLSLSADSSGSAVASPVAIGVFAGLVLGKPLGIAVFSWLAVRLGVASLPTGVTWPMIGATGIVAGIGFTMSLFIAGLAFANADLLDAAKFGVLVASSVAGVTGGLLLRALTVRARV
jgi:NhaA family Na+:H+ antiporter